MRVNPWTDQRDYALAFGAALGMSATQIAESMSDVTRNSVIGRCYRLHLNLGGKSGRGKKRDPGEKPSKQRVPKTKVVWTTEQDAALAAGVAARRPSREMAAELGHTESAVVSRRSSLGLRIYSVRRFTEVDDSIIRADYAAYVAVEDTAFKLQRSIGVIRQRLLHLNLHRDSRKARLANRFGVEVLALSDDPGEIRRQLAERDQHERAALDSAQAAKVTAVIADMQRALDAGEDRGVAFKAAMLQGATLQAVGDQVGITRERVRQIVGQPVRAPRPQRPPRTIVCKRCEEKFQPNGGGGHKYCPPCREAVAADRIPQMREYQRQYRSSEEGKRYKREWTRRSRLKEKLKAIAPTELARLLRDLADEVDTREVTVVQ